MNNVQFESLSPASEESLAMLTSIEPCVMKAAEDLSESIGRLSDIIVGGIDRIACGYEKLSRYGR